jgi:hypothetical protein
VEPVLFKHLRFDSAAHLNEFPAGSVGVDSLTARWTRFLFFAEDALNVAKKSNDVPDSCLPHVVVHIFVSAQRLQSLVIMASRAHYAPSHLSLLATIVSRTLR